MKKASKIVLIVVAAAVTGALIFGAQALRVYDNATRIDRSHPEVVVGEYVDALLVKRDDKRASLFACNDQTDLQPLKDLRSRLAAGTFNSQIQVVLGRSIDAEGGSIVKTEIEINEGGGPIQTGHVEWWMFGLKNEDGWRVCSAEQIPDPTPTPSTPPTTS